MGAEPSLSGTFRDLQEEVGFHLGYGRNPDDFSDDQEAEVDAVIQAGYRQFLTPPQSTNMAPPQWTFLKPVISIGLIASRWEYDLPDDFGAFEGDLTIVSTSTRYSALRQVGEGVIRERRSGSSTASGTPRCYAIQTGKVQGGTGQRHSLLVWPTPDTTYAVEGRMVVWPQRLTTTNKYPYGGPAHYETILASCLAVAEQRHDDMKGPMWQSFVERLTASVAYDARMKPERLGYNADRSDWTARDTDPRMREGYYTTYNDVRY